MKKIIIATDSFKGSISAADACKAIASGINKITQNVLTVKIPVADGGEGTLKALVKDNCIIDNVPCVKPDGTPFLSRYGYIGDTAVIEMSSAAGLTLIPYKKRNPMNTTTYGVGMLIRDALDHGFRKIILTVGGSSTNDGGIGMMKALGAEFMSDKALSYFGTGSDLDAIRDICITNIDSRLYKSDIILACDVSNPLTGPFGATKTYALQKGADPEMTDILERGMQNYAKTVKNILNKDCSAVSGSGAGGGIGFPLIALFDAKVCSGISAVLSACGYYEELQNGSYVITGEGCVDGQTMYGKTVSGVALPALQLGIPVVIFAGCKGKGSEQVLKMGIRKIYTLVSDSVTPSYAMNNAYTLLEMTGSEFATEYLL